MTAYAATPGDPLKDALATSRGAFMATLAFSLFINLLLFVVPLYMLQMYDRVLSSRSIPTLVLLTVIAVGLLAVMGLLEGVRSRLLVRTGVKLDSQVNSTVFDALFRGGIAGTQRNAQPLRDLETVRDFLTGSGLIALCDAPWAPLFIAVCFLFHPLLGFVALAGAVVILALALVNEKATRAMLVEASRTKVGSTGFVDSSLRNADAVRAMGMAPAIYRRWAEGHGRVLALQAAASDRSGAIVAATKSLRMILQVAVLGVGAWLAVLQEITPGAMIAASIIMARALAPIEIAVGQWRGLVSARNAYGRLGALLGAMPAEAAHMRLPRPTGALQVERLVAAPPGVSKPVLKGVGFTLRAGESLGIVGPSAAGKSTLARVLVGVWPAEAGSVRLDGSEIGQWSPEELGPHVGYLPQEVDLFAGTVAENIARFQAVEAEAVVAAACKAGVHEMIQRLPDGYDTEIGDGGRGLSGGQRQCVALARALFGDPALIVLDEPNANLDTTGEGALVAALEALKKEGRTVVLISHRPSVIAHVDKIMVLNAGTIERLGEREAVLATLTRPTPVGERAEGGPAPGTSIPISPFKGRP